MYVVVTPRGVSVGYENAVAASEEYMAGAPLLHPRVSLGLLIAASEEAAENDPDERGVVALEVDDIVPVEDGDDVALEADIGIGVKATDSRND
jgi:hypothetical protein